MSPPSGALAAGSGLAASRSADRVRASGRAIAVIALLGLSAAWNAGNIGPVASELASEFDLSLATIGV